MIMPPPRAERVNTPSTRKCLSFDALVELIRDRAEQLPDQRQDPDFLLADAIMSALALFSLKDPSLLAIDGTEYFSSDAIHCPGYLCRESKTGKKSFYHQMLSPVLCVTDLTITKENAPLLVAGGRARWRIENETFNTLKNQGYHFEHKTDFRYGFLVPLSMIQAIFARANRIERDLVICTGDYVHERRATGQNLSHLVRPVTRGNSTLWFAGAEDLWEDHRDLDGLLNEIPEADCRVILAHNSDTADTAFTSRVDLMVSGHTHGGQVDIPFVGTPVLPMRNKSYSHGLKISPRGLSVFISKGLGWAVYPIRFNCFPEIAVLELVPLGTKT
jgi:uncharacterized protein